MFEFEQLYMLSRIKRKKIDEIVKKRRDFMGKNEKLCGIMKNLCKVVRPVKNSGYKIKALNDGKFEFLLFLGGQLNNMLIDPDLNRRGWRLE